jgi:hypothetical protein
MEVHEPVTREEWTERKAGNREERNEGMQTDGGVEVIEISDDDEEAEQGHKEGEGEEERRRKRKRNGS